MLTYEGYFHKRSKYVPTDSSFFLSSQLDQCLIRLNYHVVPVITQMTNTQKINNYEMSTQKIPSSHVCSMDESKSKSIKYDKRKSHLFSTDDRESKIVNTNLCSSDKTNEKA